ncbi:unnamed protein product [Linum tenue]|uniref:Uncharacterized protein n=1 Tax=Linum tenue TaxID=586396 RepID=A0AAV0J258_9ROSI|nr:unnamed protein product [Linum tenue]
MGSKSQEQKPKLKHKKGLWSPEEDQRLRSYIVKHGHGCWSTVPINAGLQRNGKSCRLRWINYLRPGLKRGLFSSHEEDTILALHRHLGNKWSQISQHLPGRTDNEIKNHWHSYLKKKVLKENASSTPPETTPHSEIQRYCSSSSITDHYSSPSPDKPTLIPASHFRENSPPPSTADQWDPQIFNNGHHHENGPRPALPKLMFAEWLSLDSFAATSAAPLVGCSNTKGFAGGSADFGPDVSGVFGGDNNNGLFHAYPLFHQGTSGGQNSMTTTVSDGSASDVFSSQFSFDDQSSAADANNYQFVEFCSDFQLSGNDVMYI